MRSQVFSAVAVAALMTGCFGATQHVLAEDRGLDMLHILSVAKVAGTCGVLDSMIHFQKTTDMPGGDEFVLRFWTVEAARLGQSVEEQSTRCDNAVAAYRDLWEEFDSAE